MKANSFLRSPSSTIPQIYSTFNKSHKFTKTDSSPHNLSLSPQHKHQTPLFLRPPTHQTNLTDLHTFYNWAKTLASSIGPTFEQLDNGPHGSLLLRELKWFIDDVLENPCLFSHNGAEKVVFLRGSLDQMYKIWGQRVNERRPFQYIVGCEHWRDLVLSVEDGVLIPRPETGKIVDLVEECGLLLEKGGLWADLGTGSGALAIGIGKVLGGNGKVIATELSQVSVAVARYNVERYGLQDFIEVRQGSWFEPLIDVEGQLTGLVSNPPYIPSKDISGLQAEVGKHEPKLALDGGVEGMDHLTYLMKRTSTMLKPGGFFAFETNGEKQCKLIVDYLENESGSSFRDVNIVPDFAGILRFVIGFRQ